LKQIKNESLTIENNQKTSSDKTETTSYKSETIVTEPIEYFKKADSIIEKNDYKSSERIYSPLVKNISKKEGISLKELDSIIGSGKNGRLTKNDLLNYISSKLKEPNKITETIKSVNTNKESDEILEMSRMERLISDHMLSSKEKSAHVQAFIEADISELLNWREKIKNSFF